MKCMCKKSVKGDGAERKGVGNKNTGYQTSTAALLTCPFFVILRKKTPHKFYDINWATATGRKEREKQYA